MGSIPVQRRCMFCLHEPLEDLRIHYAYFVCVDAKACARRIEARENLPKT